MNYEINDKRDKADFKKITFSKFEKNKVRKELTSCLSSSKIEPACYWAAELICSGHYSELWEIIIDYISRYIHLGNPKLPIYISMRFDNFKKIICSGYEDSDLRLRNNIKIRTIFAEIISILCLSRKKHTFTPIKIKKRDEFDMANLASKLKAPNVRCCENIFKSEDPKELFISVNELAYHLSSASKNSVSACYWIEWLIEYEKVCKTNKDKCICARRSFAPVNDKYQMDAIWIIWDVILLQGKINNNPMITKILEALIKIFSIKYTPGVKRRRKYILYFAVSLLTESTDLSVDIVSNKNHIDKVMKNINIVYKEVKKNEISPKTDYLFNGIETKSNLNKTIERLEKINTILGV
tara:strand:- start:1248 stop:2309 length:1062 start_codon:yes stop_codon:yes gene_type:complete